MRFYDSVEFGYMLLLIQLLVSLILSELMVIHLLRGLHRSDIFFSLLLLFDWIPGIHFGTIYFYSRILPKYVLHLLFLMDIGHEVF